MAPKYEGLLDQDLSDEPQVWTPQKATAWIPSPKRLFKRWNFELLRPDILVLRQNIPESRLRPTAWLDGLRGFAAFIVYWHHHHLWAHNIQAEKSGIYELAFGYKDQYYFVALPFVRTFFSGGHFAVAVFFVISGYVLSYKAMGLIHKGEHGAVGDSIGSALFRRWLRLYIPVIGVTFLWVSQWHWIGIWTVYGEPKANYWDELWNWYMNFKNYSFAFNGGYVSDFSILYHAHVWSIPIEFKGSIIIYTVLSAFSRCSRNARLYGELTLIFYFMYIVDGWYGSAFVAGMLLCDLDMLSKSDQLPAWMTKLKNFKELIFFHLLIISLYLGGVPAFDWDGDHGYLAKSFGWGWLSWLKPQAVLDPKWFFLFWAATLLVAAVPRLPRLKHFFELRFCQYLGRISFALYLMHGPIIWILGDRLYSATGIAKRFPNEQHIPGWVNALPLPTGGPLGFELAFWMPQLILLPLTLYASEVVTRLFDEPSVKFSSWLYRKAQEPRPTKAAQTA